MGYKVIGTMSGTSMDGLDLAYVEFTEEGGIWTFDLKNWTTIGYSDEWFVDLRNAQRIVKHELEILHVDYGTYLGNACLKFIEEHNLSPDFIASHGHTVFHQPEIKFTYQLGDGQALANACGFKTVNDFRSLDVMLGGQGAPLVPIGDRHLFESYPVCLNLGGFANISFEKNAERIAFDVCPVNTILNIYANSLGKEYDDNGDLAASGQLIPEMLQELNNLSYYHEPAPKSLSREWLDQIFTPILKRSLGSDIDKLHTLCIHVAQQVHRATKDVAAEEGAELLITGGGALNKFLVECISHEANLTIHVPEKPIVEFKEALIFAFLGVLKIRNEVNCLRSVTGASRDSSCGVISNPQ